MAQAATGNKTKKIFDGRYEILSIVGRGSGSVVYRARHVTAPHAEVALKVLVHKKGGTPSSDQLRKEALAMVSSRHKFTIRLDDFHSVGQLCYLSMEYAPEGDLRRYMARNGGTLPIAQIERFMMQIAEALAFIHQAGILHRDIKPDNILVVNNRQVRLADFGVAVLPGEASSIEDLQKGVGTLDYMAPEVLEAVESTKRSDVYLFGVCFYEIITGVQPFTNVPLAQVIEARKNESIKPLLELRPDCPPYLAHVIERAMAFKASDRFTSARELFQTLLTRKAEAAEQSDEPIAPEARTQEAEEAHPTSPQQSDQAEERKPARKDSPPAPRERGVANTDDEGAPRSKRKRRRRRRSSRKKEEPANTDAPRTRAEPASDTGAETKKETRPAAEKPAKKPLAEEEKKEAPSPSRGPLPGNSARILNQLQEIGDEQPAPARESAPTAQSATTEQQEPSDAPYMRPQQKPVGHMQPVLDSEPEAAETERVEQPEGEQAQQPEKKSGGSVAMSALFGGTSDEEPEPFRPPAPAPSPRKPVEPVPAAPAEQVYESADESEEDQIFEPIEPTGEFDGYSEDEFYESTTEERDYTRRPGKKNMDSKRKSWITKVMIIVVLLFLADDQMQRWTSKGLAERAMEMTGIRQETSLIPFVSGSDLPFPDLPEGKYSGVISGLIKDAELPLSIVRPAGSKSIFIAIGIPGWIPAEVPVTEEPGAVRVRSSGFILAFSGVDAGDRVQGTFVNSISGEEGTWVITPLRKP